MEGFVKKFFIISVMVLLAVSVFADSYTVQSVNGRVEQERGNTRVLIKVGDVLSANTVIHTGIGSSVVLRDGDRTLTIPAVRAGKVSELVSTSNVRVGGSVARANTGNVTRTTGQVATASARASDAAAADDIGDE